jgi:hypothetical protein
VRLNPKKRGVELKLLPIPDNGSRKSYTLWTVNSNNKKDNNTTNKMLLPIDLHIPIFIKWVSSKQFLFFSFSSLFMHLQMH